MADVGGTGHALALRHNFQAVLEAVQTCDYDAFQRSAGKLSSADLMQLRDGFGRSILHHAAQQGSTQICRHMVEKLKLEVNVQDGSGEAPLAMAAATGHSETVRYLLSKGANANLRQEPEGTAPLHRAANCGSPEVLRLLLDAGCNVNVLSKTGSPLCWAASAGLTDNVRSLLQHGAEVDPDSEASPLLLAAASGCDATVELLLAAGADVKRSGRAGSTALHATAAVGMDEGKAEAVVRLLLQAGADPDACDGSGLTPLTIAAARRCLPLVRVLLPVTRVGAGGLEGVEWTEDAVVEAAQERLKQLKEEHEKAQDEPSVAAPGQQEVMAIPEPEEPDEEKALACKRSGDQVWIVLIREAFVKGEHAAAVGHYSSSLRHSTRNAVVWASRAISYLKLGEALGKLAGI